MARGSSQATGAATSAQNLSNSYGGNANALFSSLSPMLLSEAANPQGIDPATMARMDTSALQSGGGTQAAATGAARLRAARTRNAGAGDTAIQEAARSGGQVASRGILGNRLESAKLKTSQRQSALSGLGSLFSANANPSVGALGEVAQNVNANTNAENASWDWSKDLFAPIMAAAAGGPKY